MAVGTPRIYPYGLGQKFLELLLLPLLLLLLSDSRGLFCHMSAAGGSISATAVLRLAPLLPSLSARLRPFLVR